MLDLVLAREKIRADENADDIERKERRMRARLRLTKTTAPINFNDDSRNLRTFKFHMRESYQFLPKKIREQLYGN